MLQQISLKYKNKVILALFLILLGLIISFIILNSINYKCPFKELLHLWCPGCGGMRMIRSLIQLNFYQAFRYNPLLFILLIIGIFYIIFMTIYYIKKKVLIIPSYKTWIVILIILIIYMILRNIPSFNYLIPIEV